MQSKWYELKEKALALRKKGLSIGTIERRLGIRRSTLSGWFKNVELTSAQKTRLHQQWKDGLIKARKKAVKWHNAEKEKRLCTARNEALETIRNIEITDKHIVEVALALLYLGEGSKATIETGMGSSDPLILKFFLTCLRKIYNVDTAKIRCELHLRADQDREEMIRFWARELALPIRNFTYVSVDKRTAGSRTYSRYKGVCQIRCGTVAIQRKLVNIANMFCEATIKKFWARSSVG